MGGFTQIKLKDCSEKNIETQNAILDMVRVPKKYRFYSIKDTRFEYDAFKVGDGVFPERQFPKDKINSFADFKKYWSSEALGEVFVPPYGTLQFDCYFGRTSVYAMKKIGKYVANNVDQFKEFEGSFSTFMERGMTKREIKIIEESGINY